jgi:hypothetical protein
MLDDLRSALHRLDRQPKDGSRQENASKTIAPAANRFE